MQILFAGQSIATEPSEGGLDAVFDFVPGGGKQIVQTVPLLRAPDAVRIARGNRERTVSGSVILPSQPDLDTAMIVRGSFYDALPPCGALVLRTGAKTLSWASAVLESCEVIKTQKGVSVGFQFIFLPTGAATAGSIVLNNDGTAVLNNDGSPVANNP